MKLIRIRSFDNYIEASMVAGMLESEGIQSFLQDEFTVTIDPILSNAIGGIKLAVFDKDLQKANEILAENDARKKKAMACKKCGAEDVQYIAVAKPGNWITAILTFIFGSYAAAPEKKYHCFTCGYEFETLEGIVNPELN